MSYKKFERAYKRALKEYSGAYRFGGLTGVADYTDLVNEAATNTLKVFGFKDEDFEEERILGIIKQNAIWIRKRWMMYKKNKAEMYDKVHFSAITSSWGGTGEIDLMSEFGVTDEKVLPLTDSEMKENGFDLLISRINGYKREEQVEAGMFKSNRVAQYAHEKEMKKFKKLIESEEKRLSKVWN